MIEVENSDSDQTINALFTTVFAAVDNEAEENADTMPR